MARKLSNLENLAYKGIIGQNTLGERYKAAMSVIEENLAVVEKVSDYLLETRSPPMEDLTFRYSPDNMFYGIDLLIKLNKNPDKISNKVINTLRREDSYEILKNYYDGLMPCLNRLKDDNNKIYRAIMREVAALITPDVFDDALNRIKDSRWYRNLKKIEKDSKTLDNSNKDYYKKMSERDHKFIGSQLLTIKTILGSVKIEEFNIFCGKGYDRPREQLGNFQKEENELYNKIKERLGEDKPEPKSFFKKILKFPKKA